MTIAAQFLSPRATATVPSPEAGTVRELKHRGLWVLPAGAQDVRSLHGELWITQEDDSRDIVLETGQSLQTAPHGRTVVYALSDARVAVRPVRPPPGGRRARRAWAGARGHQMALG